MSIEVDPGLAYDAAATVDRARTLWTVVGEPNMFVKIPATVEGLAAIANARLAHQIHEETLAGERWRRLAAAGARPQRPLWASTRGLRAQHLSSSTAGTNSATPFQTNSTAVCVTGELRSAARADAVGARCDGGCALAVRCVGVHPGI